MRILSTLIGLFIVLSVFSQDEPVYLKKGGKIVGLGEQGDSLTASQTVNYVIELGNEVYGVLKIALESDEVSGTSAYTAYLQSSLNNENWDNIDTITHTGGGDYCEVFGAVNATDTYYRVTITATAAAQKSNIEIWGRLNEGFVIEN